MVAVTRRLHDHGILIVQLELDTPRGSVVQTTAWDRIRVVVITPETLEDGA
jgi:hypothetical protein